MKRILLLFLFLKYALFCVSQSPASHCYFGDVGIDFRTEPPTILSSSMHAPESCATISDDMGNLLFYSNGGESPTATYSGGIWNSSGSIIQNGNLTDSTGCGSSYYGAVFFPVPGEDDLYYLFKRDCVESSFSGTNFNAGLTYSIIDANANNGEGAIIEKNQQVVPFYDEGSIATSHEPLAATFHENQEDIWLFSYTKDSIYTVKIDENGPQFIQKWDEASGRICVSPDGKYLLAGSKLFAFDRASGTLSYLHEYDNMLSGEFSPNGQFLYLIEDQKLSQYDLNTSYLNGDEIASFGKNYKMFLAPNHRIYLYESYANEFSGVINCPNEIGQNTGVSLNSFYLQGGQIFQTFTNLLSNYLYNDNVRCQASISKENKLSFSVYPNPAKDGRIYLDGIGYPAEIKVTSLQGRVLHEENIHLKGSYINVENIQKGAYIIFVESKNGKGQKKIIIE